MNELIKLKINEIGEYLLREIQLESSEFTNGGLYSGKFGILLFLSYYSKYTNDYTIDLAIISYVEKLLNNFGESVKSHTFCDGFSGILYLFEFLKEENLLCVDYEESQSIIENYVIFSMDRDIRDNKYDFLHGALGCGLYFFKKENNKQIQRIINFLQDISEPDVKNKIIRWKSVLNEDGKKGYNIALSHGMASIVLFLSHVIEKGKKDKVVYELLQGGINYILSQELNTNEFGSFFPSQSAENGEPVSESRLAWCYGDLGVAYSLWHAGKVIGDEILKKKALDIFTYSTKRQLVKDTAVIDAGLCHGSAGVAMIFRRMYLETGDDVFSKATDFWIERTLAHARFNDGLVGYKTYIYKKWESDFSLLSGISGIGLILLSYIENDNQPWDKMFLL